MIFFSRSRADHDPVGAAYPGKNKGRGGLALFYRDRQIECQEVAEGEGGATAAQADVRPASSTLFFASPTHIDRPKTHFLRHASNIIISIRSRIDRQHSTHAHIHAHVPFAYAFSLSFSLSLSSFSLSLFFVLSLSLSLARSLFLAHSTHPNHHIHAHIFFVHFFYLFN